LLDDFAFLLSHRCFSHYSMHFRPRSTIREIGTMQMPSCGEAKKRDDETMRRARARGGTPCAVALRSNLLAATSTARRRL
jgi:hypothetical protein